MSAACSLSSLLATFHMPGEVWGALIAIGGVLLASRFSRKEGARQRQFEMRRAVYLEGAEAIARANTVVGRMADLELPNTEIARTMNETAARLGRVLVVATPETVRAVSDYQSTLTECLSALWPKRWELLARARTIASYEAQMNTLAADRDRWLEQIKVANVQGGSAAQPVIWKGLQFQYQLAERWRAEAAAKHEALRLVQMREQLEFLEACLTQALPMLTAVPAALTFARAELELSGDQATFQRILTESSQRQQVAVRGLARKARELADQQAAAGAAAAAAQSTAAEASGQPGPPASDSPRE